MTKLYREKHVVKRERAAFLRGWREWQSVEAIYEDCNEAVERLYPLPMIERQREVRDAPFWYRVDAGVLLWRSDKSLWTSNWVGSDAPIVTPERVRVWADLLANPSESVEDTA